MTGPLSARHAVDNSSSLVRAGDIEIEYRIACYAPPWQEGERETILFYNGNSRSMDIWLQWIPELAKQYRVVTFNPRGIGRSTHPRTEQPYDAKVLVADAIALLDALGLQRVHWVGESSGGVLGLVAALEHAARLQSLILVNTPFRFPQSVGQAYLLGEATFADTIHKYGVGEWSRRTLGYRLDLARAPQALQQWLADDMGKVDPQVMIDHFQLSVDADLVTLAERIDLPLLNLVGADSPLAERGQMEEVQRRLPRARLHMIDGFGHGLNLLAPERCVELTLDFLRNPPQRPTHGG